MSLWIYIGENGQPAGTRREMLEPAEDRAGAQIMDGVFSAHGIFPKPNAGQGMCGFYSVKHLR